MWSCSSLCRPSVEKILRNSSSNQSPSMSKCTSSAMHSLYTISKRRRFSHGSIIHNPGERRRKNLFAFQMDADGAMVGNLKLAPEVYHALSHGDPVVALESTIISHGMPYPQNLQTAREVEAVIRENGAIPATIAILDGLTKEELEKLAILGRQAQKTARRDIPQVVATGRNGATTVSATMFFASKAGIHVFVTGGIGGVHRHGEQTMDISSDLTELGRTPVAVISAGVKSILDIPRTLEFLETQGVTVVTYKTHEFPAFFTESSGCQVPCRLDSPEECARLINANLTLGIGNGTLIAVPIPKEHAASGKLMESAIVKALEEAEAEKITGSAATPFLLARVNELTGGESLVANIALVKNNALVGAKIAVALAQLRMEKITSAGERKLI
ncbi:indigoidine synthase A family protein isoform X2 [Wolffia australiana]